MREFDPIKILPRLPASKAEFDSGWKLTDDQNARSISYRSIPANKKDECIIEATYNTIFDPIYISSQTGEIAFDTKQGYLSKNSGKNTQGWGFNGKGTDVVEFKSSSKIDRATCDKLAHDADLYFAAKAQVSSKVSWRSDAQY